MSDKEKAVKIMECVREFEKGCSLNEWRQRALGKQWSRLSMIADFPLFEAPVDTLKRLRLVRALAVEIDENWIEAMQYLNMEPLAEQKKNELRKLGDAA